MWADAQRVGFPAKYRCTQGCGLGLDVSVSRRTNVSSRSRLDENCQRLGLGRLTSRSRLSLGHWRHVPETNFLPNFAGHNNKAN